MDKVDLIFWCIAVVVLIAVSAVLVTTIYGLDAQQHASQTK